MNLCQNINASWADVAGRSTFQRRRSPTFYPMSCSFDTCLIIGQLTDPAQSLCSERVWTANMPTQSSYKLQKHRQIIASLCFESDNVMFRKHVQERLAPKVCLWLHRGYAFQVPRVVEKRLKVISTWKTVAVVGLLSSLQETHVQGFLQYIIEETSTLHECLVWAIF